MNWYANKFVKRLERKTYRSVDTLPIFNWWQIHQTKDLTYLFRESERHQAGGWRGVILAGLWERVYSDYIKRYGFGKAFVRILDKKILIAELKVEKWATLDMSIQTLIDIEVQDLARLTSEASGESDFYKSKAKMERMLGFTLDPHRVSVAEFNSYISSLQEKATHVVR